jgi:hypothetical protein
MSSRRHSYAQAMVAPRVNELCSRTLTAPSGASGEHRLHRRRMTAVMGNRGAASQERDAWPQPLGLDAVPDLACALSEPSSTGAWVWRSFPLLRLLLDDGRLWLAGAPRGHAVSRQLQSRWCAADGNPCGKRSVPGSINLLPGGLDGLQGTHSGDSRHGELDGRGWLDALGPLTRCPAQHRRDTRSHRISGPITSRMPVAWQAWVIPLFYCTVAGCRLCEGGIPRYLGY